MNDPFNIAMVQECGVIVVSVDYRLAISTPVEGLMEDCLSAARWLLGEEEFADLPVIVVGESAGGHLAVATLLALRQWPDLLGRICGAVLYYGVYDLAGTASVHAAGPETLVLDGPGMADALRLLTPGLSDEERRQAPLVTDDAPSLYFYRLKMGSHVQTGIAGCFSVDEYESDVIKKHERTRRDKEDDRTRHIVELRAQTGVVFLTYKAAFFAGGGNPAAETGGHLVLVRAGDHAIHAADTQPGIDHQRRRQLQIRHLFRWGYRGNAQLH